MKERATSLLEYVVRESIYIDMSCGYEVGSDQAYVCYPIVFQTVTFRLMETPVLCQIADNIKPNKQKSTEKIDGIVALIMALDRAIRHTEETASVYDNRGCWCSDVCANQP